MTIYIATDGAYSDYHIEAVFTDEMQVKLYCATHHCDYEEWEADDVNFDTTKTPKQRWDAYFEKSGAMYRCNCLTLTFDDTTKVEKWGNGLRIIFSTDTDTAEEQARKIACDKLAQYKYQLWADEGRKHGWTT